MKTLAIALLGASAVLAIYAGLVSLLTSGRRAVLEAVRRPETEAEYTASILAIGNTARRLDNLAEWAAITRDRGDLAILARYVDGDLFTDCCRDHHFNPLDGRS